MKEAIVNGDLSVDIKDVPFPEPKDDEVLIKVIVSGMNPKDWKYPKATNTSLNSGDDIAGIVHSVGPAVTAFKVGDRVAAFHKVGAQHGSFAEYAIGMQHATFPIPETVSFEEAATIPLAYMTSAMALFQELELEPHRAADNSADKIPLLIYGASTATGAFGAQLARGAGLSPIIGVAGASQELATRYCDYVIDYRKGEDSVVKSIEEALEKEGLPPQVEYAYDAVSGYGAYKAIARVIDPDKGKVVVLLPTVSSSDAVKSDDEYVYPEKVRLIKTSAPTAHTENKTFALKWFQVAGATLASGTLKSHPYKIVPGGLNGIAKGIRDLHDNKASGVKYVFRIQDP